MRSPMPSVAPTRRRPLQALARAASWHRRKLAVLAAVAAVLTGISAAAPEGPAMITVVKARSQLPAGTVLSASDLVLDRVAASDVPEGVLTDPLALVGKTLAAARRRKPDDDAADSTAARTSVPPGHVIAPLRLADTALAALLRPGDLVDVIAADAQAGQAAVVAAGARVVTIPQVPDERARSRSRRCAGTHRRGCPYGVGRGARRRVCDAQHHLAVNASTGHLLISYDPSLALLDRVRVEPAAMICGAPRSSRVTSPITRTPASKVQSPLTPRYCASLSEGAPAGNR